jgi:hypothetical protein
MRQAHNELNRYARLVKGRMPVERSEPSRPGHIRPASPPADPPRPRAARRRLDRRTKSILAIAAAAAALVNAGAAWAYWQITEPRTGAPPIGTDVEVALRAHSDYNGPLTPG